MSAAVQSQSGVDQAAPASNEQNNNNNNNNNNNDRPGGLKSDDKPATNDKKRASVQSDPSMTGRQHNNSCSATTSGSSSQTGDDDDDDDDNNDDGRAQMSNAEYEHIRNKTLLFFLDRLYMASQEGKEARTLHDLSCLFGTREFTREMRQIVGASRNGLKKFLQSYPSLFEIEGDKVHLTQLKEGAADSQRDYNKEAVEYFKQKLLQFGSSLVPIRNLFGYRSQASQEVRHVSGKNSRDFKRFLKQNEDVFEILADEHVVLKSALRELESQGLSSLSLQQSLQPLPAEEATTMDPYLNKQLAHLIEDIIRQMIAEQRPSVSESEFRVSLEQLHARIQHDCKNQLFLKMVKTIEDLRVFLRMHPKLFKRSQAADPPKQQELECSTEDGPVSLMSSLSAANCYISLISESERRDLESQAYQASSLLQRQHSTLNQQASKLSTVPTTETSSTTTTTTTTITTTTTAATKANNDDNPTKKEQPSKQPVTNVVGLEHKSAKSETVPVTSQTQPSHAAVVASNSTNNTNSDCDTQEKPTKQQPRTHQAQESDKQASQGRQSASHKLRANAPPFVPSKPQMAANQQQQQQQQQQPQHQPVYRQNSLLIQSYRPTASNLPSSPVNRQRVIPAPIQRSVSNLSPSQYQDQTLPSRRHADLPPFDRRMAIRNYLTKGANNGSGSSQNMNWGRAQQQQLQSQQVLRGPVSVEASAKQRPFRQSSVELASNTVAHHQPEVNAASQEDLRARTVDIVREASNIITRIMTTTDAVAFDCKGFNLGFDGKITLIQFGFMPTKQVDPMQLATSMNKRFASSAPTAGSMQPTSATTQEPAGRNENDCEERTIKCNRLKPEVCVFDLITNPELAYCLKPLLESDKIVKIVHDVRNKSNALHVQFNIILNNVFDTQVANLVIQQQVTGKPAYKSRYISMSKLCEIYGDDELVRYRNMIKMKTLSRGGLSRGSSTSSSSKDVNYWRARPLTRPMILEATMDVYCLVGGIYQNLKSRIKPEYEPLFDLLNLEGVLARIKPEEIRSAKKERKIDMEVIDLKRKLYGDTMGPVVLSNREIRLLRHIDLTEGVRQKIQQCKKVAKKLERLDLKAALLKQQQEEGTAVDGQQLMSLNSQSSSLTSNGSVTNATNGSDAQQRNEQLQARLDEFNEAVMMMDSSMFDELKDTINESNSLLESLENEDDEENQLSSGHHSHNGSSINDCCRCQCHSLQLSLADNQTNNKRQNESLKQGATIAAETERTQEPETHARDLMNGCKTATVDKKDENNGDAGDTPARPHLEESSKLSDSKQSDKTPQQQREPKEANESNGDESDDSKSSACDMAVQCDLLS